MAESDSRTPQPLRDIRGMPQCVTTCPAFQSCWCLITSSPARTPCMPAQVQDYMDLQRLKAMEVRARQYQKHEYDRGCHSIPCERCSCYETAQWILTGER